MNLNDITNLPSLSPINVRLVRTTVEDAVQRQLIVVQTQFSYRRAAAVWRPTRPGQPCPAVLFLHWYEPEAADSDRGQFEAEAKTLAEAGAICLTIETLWSDRDFFIKRTQEDDFRASIEEASNIRHFIDLLLSQPGVDARRLAVVGHDFGGMYAVLSGNLDRRPAFYVLMAATPRFPDWYLYSPKLEGEAREQYIRQMAPLDPISHVAGLTPARILFQFGDEDPHVPRPRAEEFFGAASQPKDCLWYSAGHGLNAEARQARIEWLRQMLELQERK